MFAESAERIMTDNPCLVTPVLPYAVRAKAINIFIYLLPRALPWQMNMGFESNRSTTPVEVKLVNQSVNVNSRQRSTVKSLVNGRPVANGTATSDLITDVPVGAFNRSTVQQSTKFFRFPISERLPYLIGCYSSVNIRLEIMEVHGL